MFRSLSLSTTQPLFPLCYQMYLPHTPAIAPHAELSLSLPLSLSPSRAKYMHCLSSPQPLVRTHVVYLGHSLETVSLFLPHGGPHSLNLDLFIRVSFNLVFFHTQMIYSGLDRHTLYSLTQIVYLGQSIQAAATLSTSWWAMLTQSLSLSLSLSLCVCVCVSRFTSLFLRQK